MSVTMSSLESFPDRLEQFFGAVPDDYLSRAPDSWDGIPSESFTAVGQICHVRDIEIDGYHVRFRRLLREESPALESVDGYALAEQRRYAEADPPEVLATFRAARVQTLALIRGLSDARLGRAGTFADYGRVTVGGLIHYLCSHDQQHLAGLQWLLGKIESHAARLKSRTARVEIHRRRQTVSELVIREATVEDVPLILTLIRELAEYERLLHEVHATEDTLREALFGERRAAAAVIGHHDGGPVGFALFFHNFSTFLGRPGLYLEDLYVRPEHRGKGFGRSLLAHLARLAKRRGCGRLEWSVLDWNEPAIKFYKSLDAAAMDEWTVYRLAGESLDRLAGE